ncbi:hydantoinase B/oxoprolinase family protein [Amycolatopsis acidicola]|uniref:Hydantoinase B/oxoprolinase family protein n=1 Tax=Amycolatopsis acidicola TaxID=2596893 RepID=A0A5N0V0N2_9PSEU|nr:hydantoinase B/oxoprolinase family protein [Amycolatopsis acidicola]KAA9157755.1 hydantoinase B/oxoprolinase family protein [Amycolatopsis acidicola]
MSSPIPGAEVYNSRPVDPAVLRASVPASLRLHTVGQDAIDNLDPLTYEVIRHRLWSITDEMGETLKKMSGSVVVTEANDFDFALCDEVGQEVQIGLYNTFLSASLDLAVYWTLQNRAENPGIHDGDMFLCNDPWVGGGLHQNDATVYAPIFFDGELFGWSSAVAHQLDIGGVAPGSWTPRAQDVFWESLPTPPIKVVRDNVLQRDVADMWTRRSRTPMLVSLDLRAKVGANNTAKARLLRLLETYGPTTVKAVMKRIMDDAEQRLRAKLRELPDGTWHATGYQEHSGQDDRGLYKIVLAMTKADDRLTFDFRGTAAQTGMINCPYSGVRAGIMSALLPMLAGDIPWAGGGLMRCFDIIADEGTMINASFPAAVGKGPVGPAWAAGNLVSECLAKMLDSRPKSRKSVQSVCGGTFDMVALAGLDQRQYPFVSLVMDAMAGGYGAGIDRDGVDTGGAFVIPMGRAPDAEMTEFTSPVLLLWRREETDSGGPGAQRGGLSGSVCLVPHDTPAPLAGVFSGTGKATTQNSGLAGGYPGNTQLDIVLRGSDVRRILADGRVPRGLDDITATHDVMGGEVETVIGLEDAVYVHWQSGGGYGDPLHRDPEAVAEDVREAKVSEQAARAVYGVVLDGDAGVDVEATNRQRDLLWTARREAAGITARDGGERPDVSGAEHLDVNQALVDGKTVVCRHCGAGLGTLGEPYLAALPRIETGPSAAGPHVWADSATYIDEQVIFRQAICPGCATALLSQVVPADHPMPADIRGAGSRG